MRIINQAIFIVLVLFFSSMGLIKNNKEASEHEFMEIADLRSERFGIDDRVIFRDIPDETNTISKYMVTYEIRKNGNTLEYVSGMEFKGISSANPIELKLPREVDANYQIRIFINNSSGRTIHNEVMVFEKS